MWRDSSFKKPGVSYIYCSSELTKSINRNGKGLPDYRCSDNTYFTTNPGHVHVAHSCYCGKSAQIKPPNSLNLSAAGQACARHYYD